MTSTESEHRLGDELDDLTWWTRPVAERDALFARRSNFLHGIKDLRAEFTSREVHA